MSEPDAAEVLAVYLELIDELVRMSEERDEKIRELQGAVDAARHEPYTRGYNAGIAHTRHEHAREFDELDAGIAHEKTLRALEQHAATEQLATITELTKERDFLRGRLQLVNASLAEYSDLAASNSAHVGLRKIIADALAEPGLNSTVEVSAEPVCVKCGREIAPFTQYLLALSGENRHLGTCPVGATSGEARV